MYTQEPVVPLIGWIYKKRKLSSMVFKLVGQLTVLSAKSDSDVMFCLQSYQGLRIDRSHVY